MCVDPAVLGSGKDPAGIQGASGSGKSQQRKPPRIPVGRPRSGDPRLSGGVSGR